MAKIPKSIIIDIDVSAETLETLRHKIDVTIHQALVDTLRRMADEFEREGSPDAEA